MLEELVFNRDYEILIEDTEIYSSTTCIRIMHHDNSDITSIGDGLKMIRPKFEALMLNIFCILCFWNDESLYDYVLSMIKKIRYVRSEKVIINPSLIFRTNMIKYVIEIAKQNNGKLLLRAMRQSKVFLRFY